MRPKDPCAAVGTVATAAASTAVAKSNDCVRNLILCSSSCATPVSPAALVRYFRKTGGRLQCGWLFQNELEFLLDFDRFRSAVAASWPVFVLLPRLACGRVEQRMDGSHDGHLADSTIDAHDALEGDFALQFGRDRGLRICRLDLSNQLNVRENVFDTRRGRGDARHTGYWISGDGDVCGRRRRSARLRRNRGRGVGS